MDLLENVPVLLLKTCTFPTLRAESFNMLCSACFVLQVWNPSFDVAPASLITGIITEKGLIPKQPGNPEDYAVQDFMVQNVRGPYTGAQSLLKYTKCLGFLPACVLSSQLDLFKPVSEWCVLNSNTSCMFTGLTGC
jgi:hypothetical protein